MRQFANPFVTLCLAAALAVPATAALAATNASGKSVYKTNWTSSALSRPMSPRFKKRIVSYETKEKPGTIIIDTGKRYLFLVLGDGKAVRYGVGVGREGFSWKGEQRITRKAEWPDWRPPPEMREREPDLPEFVEGGPRNPLGARAMYLGNTVFRIHGTLYPDTIGRAVSSGCIRLTNDDVSDLYEKVKIGTKVIVR
jgi:lipoprotein-anchoring transpeptidase ErfK/SrfK